MKKLLFPFLLFLSCVAIGQPAITIYAYSRIVMPGTVQKNGRAENGNPVNSKNKTAVNYYIFAAYGGLARISFGEVWIRGKSYTVQITPVDSTPVVNINSDIPGNPIIEVLVPATKKQVVSISPVNFSDHIMIRASWFRSLIKHSMLVVSYLYKGKKYFLGVKKIKVLQPLAGV